MVLGEVAVVDIFAVEAMGEPPGIALRDPRFASWQVVSVALAIFVDA